MLHTLQQLFNRVHTLRQAPLLEEPLLSESEIKALYHYACSGINQSLLAERDVQQLLLGDRLSRFAGNGYEFAENRSYQPGDEARFIDWRIYARTGELYRKVFHEERRPQLWLVVDRRNTMRFGTRRRLKVTAAIRQALVYIYKAQLQQIAVGAVILNESPQWFEAKSSSSALEYLAHQLNQPCPPFKDGDDSPRLEQVVRQLQSRIEPGCIVVVLSDFDDLVEEQVTHFHHLAHEHTVINVQVLDDVEMHLPGKGIFHVAWPGSEEVVNLDCSDSEKRQGVEELLQKRQHSIESWLSGSGAEFRRLMTSDDPFVLVAGAENG